MPTLKELFENDFGAGTVKTASDNTVALEPSMEKLAMELGLFGDISVEKTAAEKEDHEENETEEKEEKEEKKASQNLGSLFDTMFPGEQPVGSIKTAEEEKTSAYEESLGSRSYDYFHNRLNARIEKMATTLGTTGSVHDASEAPQAFPTNHSDRAAGGNAIDTTPEVTDEVKKKDDARTVGYYEQKTAGFDQDHVAVMEEMYAAGYEKLAASFANEVDSMDKVAAESEKKDKEDKMDEESEKAAAECGAFIFKGFEDGLSKLGQDLHGDPDFYFYPMIENKVAEVGAEVALNKFAGKLSEIAKQVGAKAKAGASAVKEYHKGAIGNISKGIKGGASAVKEYHKGAIGNISKGIKGGEGVSKAKEIGKGVAKLAPIPALAASAYAAKKLTKKD